MTEQERDVLLNELRQQESQREKQIKRERFRRLNPYAKKGAVVFAGSSLMEQFPLYEFLQDDDLHCTCTTGASAALPPPSCWRPWTSASLNCSLRTCS